MSAEPRLADQLRAISGRLHSNGNFEMAIITTKAATSLDELERQLAYAQERSHEEMLDYERVKVLPNELAAAVRKIAELEAQLETVAQAERERCIEIVRRESGKHGSHAIAAIRALAPHAGDTGKEAARDDTFCSQCGQDISAPACGPTHAARFAAVHAI